MNRLTVPRLAAMPAVVVTGARQTGKSTLARDLIPVRRRFLSLDDLEWGQGSRRPAAARRTGARMAWPAGAGGAVVERCCDVGDSPRYGERPKTTAGTRRETSGKQTGQPGPACGITSGRPSRAGVTACTRSSSKQTRPAAGCSTSCC
ncbi:MAG: hypothetical protein F4Y14_02100 [Acidobacteria bacterium]|nr:hypothetical protein [Acidobacteriota bacterium]